MQVLLYSALLLCRTAGDDNGILAAAKKLGEAGSYAYQYGVGMEGFGRDGGRQYRNTGRFRKDVGLHVKLGDYGEIFRKGESVFVRFGDRDWEKVSKGEKKKGRRGRSSRSEWVSRIRPPHEEIERVAAGLEAVSEKEKESVGGLECRVLEGALSRKALEEGFVGRMLRRFGAGQEAEVAGTVRAWIDAEGNLVRYRIRTRVGVKLQDRDVEFGMARTATVSDAGSTELSVPDGLPE